MSEGKVKKDGNFLKLVEGLVDVILINIGFYIAFLLRFNMNPSVENIQPFIKIIPFISIASIIFFYVYETFSTANKSLIESIYSTVLSIIMINITTIAIAFFSRGFGFALFQKNQGFLENYFVVSDCNI